ncbi:hypothetical protein N8339_07815 [Gammaproteobacteria bacterium]|jgi:hypothetical protein|nr:hypothetical protein [Gammaproteobacteria bacterium]|tara:strand:+ start:102 stop:320 length:219 start_codon:yes stop_codon:yes gene_type:complete
MTSTEHDKEMVQEAVNHFELMQLADKLKLLQAMKDVINDPDKALNAFVAITHEARVSGYNFGRPEVHKIKSK